MENDLQRYYSQERARRKEDARARVAAQNDRRRRVNRELGKKILLWAIVVLGIVCTVFAVIGCFTLDNTMLLLGKIGFVGMVICLIPIFFIVAAFLIDEGYTTALVVVTVVALTLAIWVGICVWHPAYQTSDSGVLYYETADGVVIKGVRPGFTEVVIEKSYGGIAVSSVSLENAQDVVKLTVESDAVNNTIGADFFKGCTKLETLTFTGSDLLLKKNSLKGLPGLKNLIFANGDFSLETEAVSGCKLLQQVLVTDASFSCDGGDAFVECGSFDLTVRNGEMPHFFDSVETLRLSGRCEINFTSLTQDVIGGTIRIDVEKVIFLEDFDFEGSKVCNFYTTGLFNPEMHYVPLANVICIPATATRICDRIFGDTGDDCRVLYQGSREQWEKLPVGQQNGNLDKGNVQIVFDASPEA